MRRRGVRPRAHSRCRCRLWRRRRPHGGPDAAAEERRGGDATLRRAEMPTALGRISRIWQRHLPGNEGLEEEGPSSAAESAFLERAYPADTISVEQMQVFGRPSRQRRGGPSRAARDARAHGSRSARARRSIRSSLPERVQLRAQRVRRGWTDDVDRTGRVVQARRLPRVHHAGRRRRLADEERPDRRAALGVPRRTARDQRGRRGLPRPERPSGNTVYVGTGEANICASGCVAGTGLYKSTNGGDTLDAARRQHASTAWASARSWSSRGARTRSTPASRPLCAGCRPSAAPA